MVSCHRNHSLMFKVLKAAADADRSTRPGSTTPSSTPPHMRAGSPGAITPDATTPTPPGLPERRGAALVGGAEEEGVGGRGAGTKENPRAASRFRSVAAAAAEEAKVSVCSVRVHVGLTAMLLRFCTAGSIFE